MLFEDMIPIDCLGMDPWIFQYLKHKRLGTVRDIKRFLQLSTSFTYYYEDETIRELKRTLRSWRNSLHLLGILSIPSSCVPSLPPLTLLNFVDAFTIALDCNVSFQLTCKTIVNDRELSSLRMPKAIAAVADAAGCRTLMDMVQLPYDTLVQCADGDERLLVQIVEWFRKKCLIEYIHQLKSPFVCLQVPRDIAPLVQELYDEITIHGPLIEYEEIVEDLLPIRNIVAAKFHQLGSASLALRNAELMCLVFSQPNLSDAGRKLAFSAVAKKRWTGAASQHVTAELAMCMRVAGGCPRFTDPLLQQGVVVKYGGFFYPAVEPSSQNVAPQEADNTDQLCDELAALLQGKEYVPEEAPVADQTQPARTDRWRKYDYSDIMAYFDTEDAWRSVRYEQVAKYFYWLANYDMTRAELCYIFGVEDAVCTYLPDSVYRGRRGLERMAKDERLPKDALDRLKNLLRLWKRRR